MPQTLDRFFLDLPDPFPGKVEFLANLIQGHSTVSIDAKIHFQNRSKETEETKKVAICVFFQILKMAHPIMPFST